MSTWSSGTGGSGVIGALSYAGLIALGISTVNTILIMLSVPILEGIAFWLILRRPKAYEEEPKDGIDNVHYEGQSTDTLSTDNRQRHDVENKITEIDDNDDGSFGIKEKLLYLPSLFKYMIPITMVYFLEYFINQGLVSCLFREISYKEDYFSRNISQSKN